MTEVPTPTIDAGAVRWSANERDRSGRPLLVLLHGLGSDEDDLFGLSPYLPLEPAIASLRAPYAYGAGHSWFPPTADQAERAAYANAAVQGILDWLATEPQAPSIGLLGFSQGGAMVHQLMRTEPRRFAYGVQLSGFVIDETEPGDAVLADELPPVFWGRGTADPMMPAVDIATTAEWLASHASADVRI